MLEVDVDIRRLVAFLRNEALEKHFHTGGIDFRDPQAVTDCRICRRAPALAENAAATGKFDDIVVNRQKVRLITQRFYECQLMLDEIGHFLRRAFGPTPLQPPLRQLPQVARHGLPFRHELTRILVAQFIEREIDALQNLECRAQKLTRINPAKLLERPQIALTVRIKLIAQFTERCSQAYCSQGVLHNAPLWTVHVHIPRCDHRNPEMPR